MIYTLELLKLTLGFLNDPSTVGIGTKKFLQNCSSRSELFQLCDVEYSNVLRKTNKDIISKDRHQDYQHNREASFQIMIFFYRKIQLPDFPTPF